MQGLSRRSGSKMELAPGLGGSGSWPGGARRERAMPSPNAPWAAIARWVGGTGLGRTTTKRCGVAGGQDGRGGRVRAPQPPRAARACPNPTKPPASNHAADYLTLAALLAISVLTEEAAPHVKVIYSGSDGTDDEEMWRCAVAG